MKANKPIWKAIEIVVSLIVLVLAIAWMSGAFTRKIQPGKAEVRYAIAPANSPIATVISKEEPVFEEAVGTVSATRRTAVSSKIMAAIEDVRVRAGDVVQPGDILVVLDSRDIASRVEQAQEAERAAQAVLKRAEADYQRSKTLYESKTIGKSDFDQAQAAYDVAKAQAEGAKRAVEEAKVAQSYAAITSPVGGRVVDRLAEPGDLATPGRPLLNIYDPSQLRLEAPVRESLASVLKVGNPIQVTIDATKATLDGRIQEIVPQSQAGARSFTVKVVLPPSPDILSGMFGRLRIPVGTRKQLLVDSSAIERIGQLEYALAVEGKDNRIERRFVTTGRLSGANAVEILSGLREGDRVLLSGATQTANASRP